MAKKPIKREDLLSAGALALDQAIERLQGRYTSKPDRLALMRVVSQLIPALGGVLKDVDLDDLRRRIEALEELKGK